MTDIVTCELASISFSTSRLIWIGGRQYTTRPLFWARGEAFARWRRSSLSTSAGDKWNDSAVRTDLSVRSNAWSPAPVPRLVKVLVYAASPNDINTPSFDPGKRACRILAHRRAPQSQQSLPTLMAPSESVIEVRDGPAPAAVESWPGVEAPPGEVTFPPSAPAYAAPAPAFSVPAPAFPSAGFGDAFAQRGAYSWQVLPEGLMYPSIWPASGSPALTPNSCMSEPWAACGTPPSARGWAFSATAPTTPFFPRAFRSISKGPPFRNCSLTGCAIWPRSISASACR